MKTKIGTELACCLLALLLLFTGVFFPGFGQKAYATSNVAWKVFEIVYGILMPSISDCVIVLYYAMAEYRGVELKLCWIPTWWDKWGLSIKTL